MPRRGRPCAGHDADVNDVAFSHDGSMLATGDDGASCVEPETGEEIAFVNTGPVPSVDLGPSFSPDGRRGVVARRVRARLRPREP
jgi:photosystem II stability/assembly factor-like uncharacterized protein